MKKSRVETLLRFLEEQPDDPFLLFSLAREYQLAGAFEESLSYFARLKAAEPDYVGLYFHLGKLYEALGQAENARNTYLEGIDTALRLSDAHAASELRGALLNLDIAG